MKIRLGWSAAMLALISFSFGQVGASASQVATMSKAPTAVAVAVQAAAPAAAKAAAPAVLPAATISPTDKTKIPHYFGPYPNFANSPQVLMNAVVTLTGGGGNPGAVARAVVNPVTGGVSSITVAKGGSYTSAPTVKITSPGVPTAGGATATPVLAAGALSTFTVSNAGAGYTTPGVALTPVGGTITTPATVQASGGVDALNMTFQGSGYTNPIVEFSQPDAAYCPAIAPATLNNCAVATATATVVSGIITGVALTSPGSGYTTAPTVTILEGAAANPTPAVVTSTISVGRVDVLTGGVGYDSAPTVAITDVGAGGTGTGAVATAGSPVHAIGSFTVNTAGTGYLTPGLKKFVDTLPGLGSAAPNNLGDYIPIAQPDTTTYPGTDYYEIAVVQYRHKFASSLPATLMRGYVQLSTSVIPGKNLPLTNANLDPKVADTPIPGRSAVDTPSYLGPTIVANKNRPTRILFRNLLPTGVAGDLFLPVDTTIMGSGMGPNGVTLDANKVPQDMLTNNGTVTDEVRNPACGQTPKPTTCFAENRATLHLHGGVTPWISDGTPNQWVTPVGENTDYPAGVSVTNVPDMPDPGPGAETFFYSNQQSARLMFYHDHSYGTTRLNVYAGEAAGYLVTDATEAALTGTGGALFGMGLGTPLVIQDKTFVPSASKIANDDPTWNTAKWGGEGSLWYPHVYMPAQNPGDPSGANPLGRWDYGPWAPSATTPSKEKFAPIENPYYDAACDPTVQPFCEPAMIPGTPNVSVGMEAYDDTPVINGTAYPKTNVDPKAYRYRILNAANDRFWDLAWYVADPRTGTLSEVATNPAELAAAQLNPDGVAPTPDTVNSPQGPNFVQIGSEGGFLPTPVVVPNQSVTWVTDPARSDFGNVDKHALLLAAAERADVIVDFSQFAGKTLILYNDAPAAMPGRSGNYDYYTGGPNLYPDGAPTTLPGYGPNTRTIMQVNVAATAPATAFDLPNTTADGMGALNAAFAHHANGSGVFESGSDPVIVGQAAYNTAYGSNFVTTGNNCNAVSLPAANCDGFARVSAIGDSFKFDTLGTTPTTALGAQLSIPLKGKTIHDENNALNFDEWGRMTATIGIDAPAATPANPVIVNYPYVNPPTEIFDAKDMPSSLNVTPISVATDGTQVWKISDYGVDTHPLHFHLYDVQVINRVTFDGTVLPPDASELGWKETVRISPMQDTFVTMRPVVPTLPFGVPDSKHVLNPMLPEGAVSSRNATKASGFWNEAGFNNVDLTGTGAATSAPIANVVTNFGWEYVYHCHILNHEENDMMRPVSVLVPRALPTAPVLTSTGTANVHLTWTDGTPVTADPASWTLTGAAKGTAEVGFRIERAPVAGNGTIGAYALIHRALANTTAYTDTSAIPTLRYSYRVVAFNAAGDSASTPVMSSMVGFTAQSATRVLDTRIGTGAPRTKLSKGKTLTLTVPGLPAGATAVALNVTVTNPTSAGYLAVYAGGQARPTASSLNFAAGQTIANMVTVPLGPGGTVAFYNAGGAVDVIADLVGSYAPGTGGGFTGNASTRVLDTRIGTGAPAAKIGAGRTLTLTVPGLPAGATAVALNVTAVNPTTTSYLTVYRGDKARPAVGSNLNYVRGQTIANMVLVPVGAGGTVAFYNARGAVDVVADLVGSFAPGTGGGFTSQDTARVLDTRTGTGAPAAKIGAGRTLTLTVPGLPAGATAVALNVTAVNPTATSYMTVYPGNTTRPATASNLNYVPGQTIANMVLVPVGPGGTVTFYNNAGTVDVLADLAGYYGG